MDLAHSAQTVIVATLVVLVCLYIPKFNLNAQLRKLPAFGGGNNEKQRSEFIKNGKKMYIDAYKKVSRISTLLAASVLMTV